MFWQPWKSSKQNPRLAKPYEFAGLEVQHFSPGKHIAHRLDRTFLKQEHTRADRGDKQTGHHQLDDVHLSGRAITSVQPVGTKTSIDQFAMTKLYSPSPGAHEPTRCLVFTIDSIEPGQSIICCSLRLRCVQVEKLAERSCDVKPTISLQISALSDLRPFVRKRQQRQSQGRLPPQLPLPRARSL